MWGVRTQEPSVVCFRWLTASPDAGHPAQIYIEITGLFTTRNNVIHNNKAATTNDRHSMIYWCFESVRWRIYQGVSLHTLPLNLQYAVVSARLLTARSYANDILIYLHMEPKRTMFRMSRSMGNRPNGSGNRVPAAVVGK